MRPATEPSPGVFGDALENCGKRHFDLPAEIPGSRGVVHSHPRDVIPARRRIRGRNMAPETFVAPGGELRERHGVGGASAGRIDALSAGSGGSHLSDQEGGQIARVKCIPRLMPGAIESDVAKRPAPQMRVYPIREDALVRRAELPGAGEHPAASDPHREIERLAIFERHDLRRQLGRAVERNRRGGGELLPDPVLRQSARQWRRRVDGKGPVVHPQGDGGQRGNRVNAAAAEQHEAGLVLPAVFEYVAERAQVVLEKAAAAAGPGETGQHAGIGGCVDHPVAGGQARDVARRSQVAMNEPDAQLFHPRPIGLRPRTHQIVDARYADPFHPVEQAPGERAAHKTTHSGDEDPHEALFARRCFQLALISSTIAGSVFESFQSG